MGWAFGILRWSPDDFWAATPHEFLAALDGYMEAHGGGREAPMDRAELEALIRRYSDKK